MVIFLSSIKVILVCNYFSLAQIHAVKDSTLRENEKYDFLPFTDITTTDQNSLISTTSYQFSKSQIEELAFKSIKQKSIQMLIRNKIPYKHLHSLLQTIWRPVLTKTVRQLHHRVHILVPHQHSLVVFAIFLEVRVTYFSRVKTMLVVFRITILSMNTSVCVRSDLTVHSANLTYDPVRQRLAGTMVKQVVSFSNTHLIVILQENVTKHRIQHFVVCANQVGPALIVRWKSISVKMPHVSIEVFANRFYSIIRVNVWAQVILVDIVNSFRKKRSLFK